MREARLVGLNQDGTQLILAMAETGEEFAVPVDDRLRAALRGDRARLGQLEIQMESALRPRDIQARIRAGESPEAVAAVAQMPMERVMAFAGPVLAERDHIATLAQRASVRRRGGGDAPTRNLGAWVTDRLRLRHVDPTSAEWDAWRREDGRWAVRVSYFVESEDTEDNGEEQKDEKIGMFAYDAPGRYVVPDDDEARWLVGEQAQVLPTPVQPQPGERRLAAVADIDPLIAPDHGADSYEAGFEDTVALRRRNHPVSRDPQPFPDGTPGYRDGTSGFRDGSSGVRDASGYRDGSSGTRETSGYRDGAAGMRDGASGFRDGSAGVRDASGYRDGGSGARDGARDGASGFRDDSQGFQRDDYRRDVRTSRDTDRGPRRVHSVPNPDEEPTLIDVPVDQPPAPRPSVRAVERPTTPPTYASPAEDPRDYRDDQPDEGYGEEQPRRDFRDEPAARGSRGEQAARELREDSSARDSHGDQAPAARATSHEDQAPVARATPRGDQAPARGDQAPVGRSTPSRTAEPSRPAGPRPTAPRPADPRTTRSRTGEDPAAARTSDDNQQAEPTQAERTRPEPSNPGRASKPEQNGRPANQPAASVDQPALPEGTDDAETPAEPKKKPARRGKRASVPSWDEIMFGKKAD
ncbi:septation protein SepH [Kribbella sp. GL6]|uniref:septation protein SepH n=1 Tax=Kribbella sp. GL6 TaxID=3419765 RepID=UPI003CFF8994